MTTSSPSSTKRKVQDDQLVPSSNKRAKPGSSALVKADGASSTTDIVSVPRTSGLSAPNLKLVGHEASVTSVKFDPTGNFLASGSHDKTVFLWDVFAGGRNSAVLHGEHKNAILEVCWVGKDHLLTASADKTLMYWDIETEKRVKKFSGHEQYINACCHLKGDKDQLVASASDDGTVRVWDVRQRSAVHTFPHMYQVTAVCSSFDGQTVFSGGIDNIVRGWDLRKGEVSMELKGHSDTISCLRLHPDGNSILSNSMDSTMFLWDVRPFVPNGEAGRCKKVFRGGKQNFEKSLLKCSISASGNLVGAGSAARTVCVWDTFTSELLYELPGHTGSVLEVDFHPNEPIVASCSSDRAIYVGEIASA